MPNKGPACSAIKRFRRNEEGSATIEAVLWLPLFVFFFVMLADAATIFTNQARILRIVQDGTRIYSVGGLADCAALNAWLDARVGQLAPGVQPVCDDFTTPGIIVTRVDVPAGDIDLSGVTGMFGGLTVRVQTQMMVEV